MNHAFIGLGDKTEPFLDTTTEPFLLIDDGPIADAFAERFPKAKRFDVERHSFNPLASIDHKRARDFATMLYTASPEGKETLTVRNGRRAIARYSLKFDNLAKLLAWLERKADDEELTPTQAEALGTIDDLLLSPVLRNVLCGKTNFYFGGSIIARLDRAVLGDFDAFVLAATLIGQYKGHVIITDFGFYGREFHMSLIRQKRLTLGVNSLSELSDTLRQAVLLMPHKQGAGCTWEDAEALAKYAGLNPGTVAHTEFIQRAMAA